MLFGKKDKKKKSGDAAEKQPDFEIETMPDAFYGGKNPVVYEQSRTTPSGSAMQKKASPIKASSIKKSAFSAVGKEPIFKKKWFLITTVTVFVAAVAGISWYYIYQANRAIPRVGQTNGQRPTSSLVEIPIGEVEEPAVVAPPEQATTTDSGVATSTPEDMAATSTPSLADQPIEFPSTFLVDSSDIDSDNLTDVEEELFGTDSGNSDTDSDGYFDGLEIYNLYNPRGLAPIRLVDSGLVREYVHPLLGYRLYYPAGWEIGTVDPEGRQVLFSAATGDFIEIRAVEKQPNDSFAAWFGRNARGQQFLDLETIVNRFEEEGYQRDDSLVAYFVMDRVVYVLVYHPGVTGTIPYRNVMRMMTQSFRPDQTFTELPEQAVLPSASETATTTTSMQ